MDFIPEKLWAIIAAVISALGGFFVYERKRVDNRLNKIEQEMSEHKVDVAVVRESLTNLKEDTQEIKVLLQDLLIIKRRK